LHRLQRRRGFVRLTQERIEKEKERLAINVEEYAKHVEQTAKEIKFKVIHMNDDVETICNQIVRMESLVKKPISNEVCESDFR
jgi:hypothetical protein